MITITKEQQQDLAEQLSFLNPNALLLEPREFFDSALIGFTTGPSTRRTVAVYDRDLVKQAVMKYLQLNDPEWLDDPDFPVDPEEEVESWISYNTEGSDLGENSPIIVQTL